MARETKRWRPPPTGNVERDNALKLAFDSVYSLENIAVLGVETGITIASGTSKVTGSEKEIATGLSEVVRVVACLEIATAVNEWVTAEPSPTLVGGVDLYAWKPTAAGDTTPIASTTERDVAWIAWGALNAD